jgi:hypothetical protein
MPETIIFFYSHYRFRSMPSETILRGAEIFRGSTDLWLNELQTASHLDHLLAALQRAGAATPVILWRLQGTVNGVVDMLRHRPPPPPQFAHAFPASYYDDAWRSRTRSAALVATVMQDVIREHTGAPQQSTAPTERPAAPQRPHRPCSQPGCPCTRLPTCEPPRTEDEATNTDPAPVDISSDEETESIESPQSPAPEDRGPPPPKRSKST